MSSFFTIPGSARKRKRAESGQTGSKKPRAKSDVDVRPPKGRGLRKNRKNRDEDISSEEEDDAPRGSDEGSDDEDEELAGETAAERRLRLAQQYLDNIREEVDEGGFDAGDIDRDLIAERLKEDVAESKGRIHRWISSQYSFATATTTLFRPTHPSPTTGIAVCLPHIYTVSIGRHLTKWALPRSPPTPPSTSLKPTFIRFARGAPKNKTSHQGHIDAILCVAASADGKFVVTGGRDKRLVIWDAQSLKVVKVFNHHRSPITGLCFRRGTNNLFSCAADRTIKLWSLDELAYVETLFGHQDEIMSISALAAERCVSVGARDRTARLWKIVDETQLVFKGGASGDLKERRNKDGSLRYEEGSMDCVAMVDDEHFVTGSDNGNICLWSVNKKKPVYIAQLTHGLAPPPPPGQSSAEMYPSEQPPCADQPRYVTALAAIPYSDLVFSGSWDGSIRAWQITQDKKKLEPLGVVGEEGKVRGIVNGISLAEREREDSGGQEIVVAVGTGKELRLGRWLKVEGRNGGYVVTVQKEKLKAIEAVKEGEGEGEGEGDDDDK